MERLSKKTEQTISGDEEDTLDEKPDVLSDDDSLSSSDRKTTESPIPTEVVVVQRGDDHLTNGTAKKKKLNGHGDEDMVSVPSSLLKALQKPEQPTTSLDFARRAMTNSIMSVILEVHDPALVRQLARETQDFLEERIASLNI